MCVKTFVKLKFPSHTKCSFEVQAEVMDLKVSDFV